MAKSGQLNDIKSSICWFFVSVGHFGGCWVTFVGVGDEKLEVKLVTWGRDRSVGIHLTFWELD